MFAPLTFALALAATPVSPAVAQNVTLSLRAAYAPAVVNEVAERAGLRLSVDKLLARELLVVEVKDMPVEALLARIAESTAAEWQRQGEALLLTRREAATRSMQAAEEAHIVASLQAVINERRDATASRPPIDEASARAAAAEAERLALQWQMVASDPTNDRASELWAQFAAVQAKNPVQGALPSIVASLDLSTLARLPAGSGLVISNNPTRVQRAFPPAAQPAIRALLGQLKTWHDVVERSPSAQIAGMPAAGAPATVLVFAQVSDRGPGWVRIWFQLQVLDGTGRAVGGTDAFSVDSTEAGKADEAPTGRADEEPVPFSADVVPYAELLISRRPRDGGEYVPGPPASPVQTSFLSQAEKHPFASLLATDVLRAEAARQGRPLVANVSQRSEVLDALTPDGRAFRLNVAVPELLGDGLELRETEGCLVVVPRWPAGTTADRWDPVAEGRLLAAVANGTYLSLAQAAELSEQLRDQAWAIPALELILDPRDEFVPPLSAIAQSPWLMRFFRSLSAGQRQALDAGRTLAGGDLNAAQRQIIAGRLFNTGAPTPLTGQDVVGSEVDYEASQAALIFRQIIGDTSVWAGLSGEATLVLGAGLPPGTMVGVQAQPSDLIMGYTDGGADGGQMLDVGQLAWIMFAKENELAMDSPVPTRFRIGRSTTYQFDFMFTDGLSYAESLNDVYIDTSKPPVSFDQLPEELRQRIDQAKRDLQAPPPPPG